MIAWLKRLLFGEKRELTPKERARDLREWWVSQSQSYHGGYDTMSSGDE